MNSDIISQSRSLRIYFYITAALTGAVVMIVEVLGTKILAPYIGTSHFVWIAQIETTLFALAVGYFLGGKLVARNQCTAFIYACLFAAGICLYLVPWTCERIAFILLDYPLQWASVLLSFSLFFIPLTLLAMVAPFLIRKNSTDINQVATEAGILFSISTLGSMVGIIWIGYFAIPLFPNSVSLYLSASVLVALAVVYFIGWGKRKRSILFLLPAILAGLFGYGGVIRYEKSPFFDSVELFRKNSDFGMLNVIQLKNSNQKTYLLNDFLDQGDYLPATGSSGALFSYALEQLARAYTSKIQNVLCIGLGAGLVPTAFLNEGASVDVVEINPALIPIARKYFDCRVDLLDVHLEDGRCFLNRSTKSFDVIVLDTFLGESSPSHLLTEESFRAVKRMLNPEGVICINTAGFVGDGTAFFSASLEKTLRAVFADVKIHTAETGNVFFVASDRELLFRHTPDLHAIDLHIKPLVEMTLKSTRKTNPNSGVLLTDNYNPIEFYDAQNRMQLRQTLAKALRNQRLKSFQAEKTVF